MNAILTRMRWEATLLNRNNLLTISMVITGIYIALLQLLKSLGHLELVSMLLVLNDPAVIGALFAGITIIFERDQHTLDALRVAPLNPHHYLMGKVLVLSLLGTACGWAMMVAALGFEIDHLHFCLTLFLITFTFSNIGVGLALRTKRFINFALKVALILVILIIPIFDWFGIFTLPLKEIFPMEHGILLLAYAMNYQVNTLPWYSYLVLGPLGIGSYLWAYFRFIHTKE